MTEAVAVLGLGSIGLRHARNLRSLGVSVIGFDPLPARRDLVAAEGMATARSRDEAIDGSRAVVVATPNLLHLTDLAAAVDAGRHVFIEKPLAHTTVGVADILARARAKHLVVFAGLMLRWHPAVTWAAARINDGALGELLWGRSICASHLPSWRPGQDHRVGYASDQKTGGVLFDVIHEFDLLHHLLGAYRVATCTVRCTGRLGIPSDDLADAVLAHAGGAQSSLHVDYLTPVPVRVTDVTGTLGRLSIDLIARSATFWRAGSVPELTNFVGSYDEDYVAEMRDFMACMAGEKVPRCSGEEALTVLEQIVDARRIATLPAA